MMVVFSYFAKAGNSCSSADSIVMQDSIQVYHQYPLNAGSSNWFKFIPDSTAIVISFKNTFGTSDLVNVEKIKIYSGNCSYPSLFFDTIFNNNDSLEFKIQGLSISGNYFLEIDMKAVCGNFISLSIYNGIQSPQELLWIGSPICSFPLNQLHCRENYVCNPSFENTYSTAPPLTGLGQLNSNCENWGSPNAASPDYYNANATPVAGFTNAGVPINYLSPFPGTNSFNGNSYSGLVSARIFNNNLIRYREYVTTRLRAPLKSHKVYRSSFSAILSPTSSFATNNLGMAFTGAIPAEGITTNGVVGGENFIFDPTPDIINTNIIIDTTNWTDITGCFTTTENNIEFVTIGNFSDDFSPNPQIPLANAVTNVVETNTTNPLPGLQSTYVYYFIDQVEVVQLADAGPDTTLCPNASLVIGCDPISNTIYSWDALEISGMGTNLNQFLSCIDCPTPTFTHNSYYGINNYSYVVTVTDTVLNCSDSDTINITILHPNNILTGPLTACPPQPGAYYSLIPGVTFDTSYVPFTEPAADVFLTTDTLFIDWSTNGYLGGVIRNVGIEFFGCMLKIDSIRVRPCCDSIANSYTNLSSTELIFAVPPANTDGFSTIFDLTFNINGTLFMDKDLTLINCNVAMGTDAEILQNSYNLTIDNSHLQGCEYRWLGIQNPGGFTSFSNISSLADADLGLEVTNDGGSEILFSKFYDNLIDVRYTTIADTNQFGNAMLKIIGSEFNGNHEVIPLVSSPTVYVRSLANLVLNRIPHDFSLKIGDESDVSFLNIFSVSEINVGIRQSNIEFLHNRFNNSNIGISNEGGLFPNGDAFKLKIGDMSASDENNGPVYFNMFQRNAAHGIYSEGASVISIYDNKFYDSRIGIEIRENDAFPLQIRENRILGSFLTGINMLNNNVDPNGNNYSTHIARNNYITDNNFNLYGDFSVGIVGQSIAGTNDAVNFIQQNSIKGVNFGIVGINTTKMDVSDNRVHLKPHLIFDINYGIGLYGCNSPQVLTNIINSTTDDINVQGIIVDQTMGANLCGNQVVEENTNYQIGTSYVFKGASGAAVFRDNLSNNFTRGIYLGSVAAPMGVQGNSNAASSNRWANMNSGGFHTFCEPAVTGSSNLIFNPSSGPLPIVFGEYWPSGYTWATLNSHFLLEPSSSNFTDCGDSEAPSENAQRIAYFDDIAKDSTKTIGFSPSRKYIYKEALANATLSQPELLSFSPIEQFQDSINPINLGKTRNAKLSFKHHMTVADSLLFLQKVNELESGTNPENLNKEVLLLLSKNPHIKDSTYTAAEITRLKQIANYCPYTKGNAVYTARAMLRTINPLDMFYINNCEKGYTSSGNRKGELDEEDKEEYDKESFFKSQKEVSDVLLLNPNPTKQFITASLLSGKNFENYYKIEIYSIDGRVCNSFDFLKNKTFDVSLMSDGIYFAKLISSDNSGFLLAKFIINK